MPRNHEITDPNRSPRAPSVLSSHPQATVSHPKANIRLRVRNRHLKSTRNWRFQEENGPSWKMTGNPSVKSCACSPATLSTEGFFKNPLRKLLFLRFCRKSEISEFRSSGTSSVGASSVGPPRFGVHAQVSSWLLHNLWHSDPLGRFLVVPRWSRHHALLL